MNKLAIELRFICFPIFPIFLSENGNNKRFNIINDLIWAIFSGVCV